MKKTTVKCAKCKGTGLAPLTGPLAETFAKFTRGAKLSAGEVGICGVAPNAMLNRLESLRRLGLLERRREGQAFIYSRVKTPSAKK